MTAGVFFIHTCNKWRIYSRYFRYIRWYARPEVTADIEVIFAISLSLLEKRKDARVWADIERQISWFGRLLFFGRVASRLYQADCETWLVSCPTTARMGRQNYENQGERVKWRHLAYCRSRGKSDYVSTPLHCIWNITLCLQLFACKRWYRHVSCTHIQTKKAPFMVYGDGDA